MRCCAPPTAACGCACWSTMSARKANDDTLLSLDSHPNIEIRLFNPVASRSFRGLGMLTDFSRVNRRMHNKAFVADNQRAILGGRNIGDEYFEAPRRRGIRRPRRADDGPVVGEVSKAFDSFWNAPMSIPVAALPARRGDAAGAWTRCARNWLRSSRRSATVPMSAGARSPVGARAWRRLPKASTGARPICSYDDPAKVSPCARGHRGPPVAAVRQARPADAQRTADRLALLHSRRRGRGLVARAGAERGVRVTVLTNSLAATDVGAVHAGYKRYREALLEAGVRLYELRPEAIEYARGKDKNRQTAVHVPRCMPRPSCSTGVPCSSARSTSIPVRCSSIPRSAWCAKARRWPRRWPAARGRARQGGLASRTGRRSRRQGAPRVDRDHGRGSAAQHRRARGQRLAQVRGVVPRAAADRVAAVAAAAEGVRNGQRSPVAPSQSGADTKPLSRAFPPKGWRRFPWDNFGVVASWRRRVVAFCRRVARMVGHCRTIVSRRRGPPASRWWWPMVGNRNGRQCSRCELRWRTTS